MITEPRFSLDWVRLFPPVCQIEILFRQNEQIANQLLVTASTHRRKVEFHLTPEMSCDPAPAFTRQIVEPVMEKLMGMD